MEQQTRLKRHDGDDRQGNLHSLEHDEDALILDQIAVPALAQLDDAIDTPDEDTDDCEREEGDEQPELVLRDG